MANFFAHFCLGNFRQNAISCIDLHKVQINTTSAPTRGDYARKRHGYSLVSVVGFTINIIHPSAQLPRYQDVSHYKLKTLQLAENINRKFHNFHSNQKYSALGTAQIFTAWKLQDIAKHLYLIMSYIGAHRKF